MSSISSEVPYNQLNIEGFKILREKERKQDTLYNIFDFSCFWISLDLRWLLSKFCQSVATNPCPKGNPQAHGTKEDMMQGVSTNQHSPNARNEPPSLLPCSFCWAFCCFWEMTEQQAPQLLCLVLNRFCVPGLIMEPSGHSS